MENISPNYIREVKRQKNPIRTKCTICGASAIYSYYGVIACQPCKVFFRKNARRGLVS